MVRKSMDVLTWLRKQLEEADPDLLRSMVNAFVEVLMGAEVDALCNAEYNERSVERENYRNGYRSRKWDARAGSIELRIPKLRSGSYFPDWLIEPRRRAEQALIAVVADCYLAGVSTRRVDKLVKTLGIDGISKSQVSRLAQSLDEIWSSSDPARSIRAPTRMCDRRARGQVPRGRSCRQRRRHHRHRGEP